jgi:hypothetical protein
MAPGLTSLPPRGHRSFTLIVSSLAAEVVPTVRHPLRSGKRLPAQSGLGIVAPAVQASQFVGSLAPSEPSGLHPLIG